MSATKGVRVKPIEWKEEHPHTAFGYIGDERVAIVSRDRPRHVKCYRGVCLLAIAAGTKYFASLEEAKAGAEKLVRAYLARFVEGL